MNFLAIIFQLSTATAVGPYATPEACQAAMIQRVTVAMANAKQPARGMCVGETIAADFLANNGCAVVRSTPAAASLPAEWYAVCIR